MVDSCSSLGKKATKAKIKKLLKEAGKKKPGSITLNEFVDYMIAKKQLKEVTFSIYNC